MKKSIVLTAIHVTTTTAKQFVLKVTYIHMSRCSQLPSFFCLFAHLYYPCSNFMSYVKFWKAYWLAGVLVLFWPIKTDLFGPERTLCSCLKLYANYIRRAIFRMTLKNGFG